MVETKYTEIGRQKVELRVSIVRWVSDEPQPGIVECRFVDRFGREWFFMEKCPIVSFEYLYNNSEYPQSGVIECSLISYGYDDDGRRFAVVDTEKPWGIEAIGGNVRFEVFFDQLEN